MSEQKPKYKIQNSEFHFVSPEEEELLWGHEDFSEENNKKRSELWKTLYKDGKACVVVGTSRMFGYNLIRPKEEQDLSSNYPVYSWVGEFEPCTSKEFFELMNKAHKEQKGTDLPFIINVVSEDLTTYKQRDAALTQENLNLIRDLEMLRKDYAILKEDHAKIADAIIESTPQPREEPKKNPWAIDPDLESGRAEMLEKVFGKKPQFDKESVREDEDENVEEESMEKCEKCEPDWEEEYHETQWALQKLHEKYEKLEQRFWTVTKILTDQAVED